MHNYFCHIGRAYFYVKKTHNHALELRRIPDSKDNNVIIIVI